MYFCRMDLLFEKPEVTGGSLLATQIGVADHENFIHTINGVDAYGNYQSPANIQVLLNIHVSRLDWLFLQYKWITLIGHVPLICRDCQCPASSGHCGIHAVKPDHSTVCPAKLHSEKRCLQGM